jgi:LysM repeat protein
MTIKIAAAAVSLAMLSGIAGTNVSNHAVQLSAQSKPKASATVSKAAQPTAKPAQPAPVIVAVQSGDTLSGIATANNTTYDRVFDANESLSDPNVINPGQQLRIPTADENLPDRMAAITPVVSSAPVAQAASPATTTYRAPSYTAASYPVSGDSAKAFIYSHESGNNPNATNPTGCYGLGQDCNGRVRAMCGADYACQDAYFTSYANSRYGGWGGAVAFWQTHGWW